MLSGMGCAKKQATVAGMIFLAPALASQIKSADRLFIIARNPQGGPPLAVKKIEHPSFPLKYQLSEADAMIEGRAFEGMINVVARISRGGDAMPQKGDFEGACGGNPLKVGEQQANITIDKTL